MAKSRSYRRLARLAAFTLCAAATHLALAVPAGAARTDVVILRNGDHITGEIKNLGYGKLEYKTDDMDRVYIEWNKIHHITSANRFEIVDTDGLRRWGSVGRTDTPQEMVINTSAGPDTLDLLSVVRMTRIKETFLRRLKGSIFIGFSYTRATQTTEAEVGGDTKYRGESYGAKLEYNAYITEQSDRRTSRYNLGFNLDRFLMRRWTVGGAVSLEHNEELGLDKRSSLTAMGSRYVLETNRTVVRLSAGLSGTRETYLGSDSTSYNLELPLEFYYSRFQFHNPESSIEIWGALYPNLTTGGRYRASVTTSLDHEVYRDLHFVISFYYDYDSKPPRDSAKDDYRLSTSLKWTFG
jgi:hypothetical protein